MVKIPLFLFSSKLEFFSGWTLISTLTKLELSVSVVAGPSVAISELLTRSLFSGLASFKPVSSLKVMTDAESKSLFVCSSCFRICSLIIFSNISGTKDEVSAIIKVLKFLFGSSLSCKAPDFDSSVKSFAPICSMNSKFGPLTCSTNKIVSQKLRNTKW
ncbi:hypothetical protein ACJW30_01G264000 [Castanea mollissima]